jgi:TRAP-type C4-dicarboxylate transport system substrate-binding protein
MFGDGGFVVLGTGDVGISHVMSRGGAVRVPDDLKKFHPFYISGDVIGQKMLEIVGVSNPKSLGVPQILPALASRQEGAIDVINSPAIAAEQLQWAPNVDTVNTLASGIGIGALVINKERYDALPADVRAVLERTGKNAGKLLTERIRGLDEAAFNRMKQNKTVIEPNDTEKAAWAETFKKVRQSLKNESKIKADVFDEVTAAATGGG